MDGGAEGGGSGRRRRSRRPPRNLLPFQRRMVEELLEEDGLCVMASGMGLPAVAGALLRLQVLRRRTPGQRGAAFVVGAAEWQRDLLMEELAELDEEDEDEDEDGEDEEESGEGDGGGSSAADAFAALRRGGQKNKNKNRSQHGPAAAVVTAETPAASRASLYATAGVVFVSTRILVVDFLTGRVGGAGGTTVNQTTTVTTKNPQPQPQTPPAELAGLLVLNAHRSTPNSADAFAAALARAAAPAAWLRALSDAPQAFLGGFARAERVLGALRLRRLRLWPRFEATVKEALRVNSSSGGEGGREGGEADDDGNERLTILSSSSSSTPVQVVELAVRPTPEMASAYEAIADLMDACLRELRRCPALASAANVALLTLEGAGVLPSSDAAIANALEAAGMRSGGAGSAGGASGARARGAAADLRTLRALADALLRLDAVSFLRRLETLRAVDTSAGSLSGGIGGGGGWLLHDAAHALFSAAKRRVFVLVRGRGGGGGGEEEGKAGAAAASAGRGGSGKRQRGGDTSASASAPDPSVSTSSNTASVVPVLEPLPKWSLVLDILAEIQAERERLLSPSPSSGGHGDGEDDDESFAPARVAAAEAPVLVVSRDARTAAQLRACVAAGGTGPVMRSLYADYLASRLRAAAAGKGRSGGGGRGGRGGRGRGGRGRGGRGRGQASSSAASAHPAERLGAVRAARLRGSGAEEAALLQEAKKKEEKKEIGGGGDDAEGEKEEGAPSAAAAAAPAAASASAAAAATPALIFDDDSDEDEEGLGTVSAGHHPLLQGVAFACLDDHSAVGALLRSARPSFLVICDPDVSFVRAVELYAASLEHEEFGGGESGSGSGNGSGGGGGGGRKKPPRPRPRRPLRVYHLRYEHSLESDAYSARLSRERRAFEQLISAKAHMSLPDHAAEAEAIGVAAAALRDPGSSAGLLSLSPAPGSVPREPSTLDASSASGSSASALSLVARPSEAANELTRLGGGGAARARARLAAAARLRVVVDVREFMASAALPAALHARGLTLAPCTLEVGDYVLSPALCVERKAIPDLRQSLSSGRLFVQARAMTKHYAVAALLIEFDGDKPFTLNGGVGAAAEGGKEGKDPSSASAAASTPFDSGAHSLPARLAILALQFPRLRFLWARSPHAAADLFVALKAGAAREPDADVAAAIGNDEASLALEGSGGASASATESRSENAAAVDLLRKLPGVTDSNWRRLADAAGSLAGLARLSEEALARIMSGGVGGVGEGGGGGEGESGVVARNAARRLRAFLQSPCPFL